MVDTLPKTLDKIVNMREFRAAKGRKLHTGVIGPVSDDLLDIHRGYPDMFEKVSWCPTRKSANADKAVKLAIEYL